MASSGEFRPLLGQSIGYGVVVGIGFFFALVMVFLTQLQAKFTSISPKSSEEFTSASRNIKPGLVCCGIVSAWTWSATLLQSSTASYTFGVSGGWWYGVGGTIWLVVFGMIAAKVKMNANGAHTFLEIVQVRFGTGAHLLFTFYGFLCIMIVCGSLLLGGAATVNALTGINIIAACMLLPIGIAVYVIWGGLRATFVCDWSHTIILFAIIYTFVFHVYGTSPVTGGVHGMYNLLVKASINFPVEGNTDGSYLTFKSNQGLVFGAAATLGGGSGVFCDQGYWQRAIASDPRTTTKAYMLGGLSWFAVPFAFASCLGLAARALVNDPRFPTYPHPLSPEQTSAGLAAPAAAAVIMGKGGAVAILLVVFMAVTSAVSAELIGVSSLFAYDVYRTYFRPSAKGPEIVRVSHYFICFWAVWMGCWATILNKAGIDLGWLYYVQGVVLSPAVIPIGLTVSWKKLTKQGVLIGTLSGQVAGMMAWMIGCWKIYGEINVQTLAGPYSAVCGDLAGLIFSTAISVGVSLYNPDNYDFHATRTIANLDTVETSDSISSATPDPERGFPVVDKCNQEKDPLEAGIVAVEDTRSLPCDPSTVLSGYPVDLATLKSSFNRSAVYSSTFTIIVAIVVPLPMFFANYVFSVKFFGFWIAVSIIWVLLSGVFCVVLPIWESRRQISIIIRGCYDAMTLAARHHRSTVDPLQGRD